MEKYMKIVYGISLALVVFMLGFFLVHERTAKYEPRENTQFGIFEDYQVTTYEDDSAPAGITQEYRWVLRDVPKINGCVTFYSIHQEVEIFIGDELVYSLNSNMANSMTKTVGCDWPKAFLYAKDEGEEIRILVHPVYGSSINNELTIYYGNFDAIRKSIIYNNLPILAMGIVCILIGIIFILFVLANIRSTQLNRSIAMLGIFSIFAGLWKISDMTAAPFLFEDTLTLSATAIISLSMMVIPFTIFVRNQMEKTTHRFWDFLCIIFSLVSIVIVLLQLTGVADLRQTLSLCHFMILVMIVAILTALIREAARTKLPARLSITIICCFLCLLGSVIDMVIYYRSGYSGNTMYCLIAFLTYVILMGCLSVSETRQLIERGKEASHYEQLAMHDELTGLYNRAFYSSYLKKHDLQTKDCFIVMLDVNNLKQCNDSAGHACGDQLLKNSAGMIEHAFQPSGKCIRLGGDEFCVVLRGISENECQNCLKLFDELIIRFNNSYPEEFPVNIAYGYAHFDATLDFDFGDTLRRADKRMYQMKMDMKSGEKAVTA